MSTLHVNDFFRNTYSRNSYFFYQILFENTDYFISLTALNFLKFPSQKILNKNITQIIQNIRANQFFLSENLFFSHQQILLQ